MNKLNENWLTDGLIDFEYKKYVLLAYLTSVEKNFAVHKLYPDLGELVNHYNILQSFVLNKQKFSNGLPKRLESMDMQNFVLHYERVAKDDNIMEELSKIVDFSLPAIKKHLEEGKEIYEWIENMLELRPVGIQPLDAQFGYLFLRNGEEHQARIYEYRLSIFEKSDEKYRGIHTHYITSYTTGINFPLETLKARLIKEAKLLSIPAVYAIESSYSFPEGETLLPIAKRILVKFLAEAGY
jgi:hypothetical protein